MLDLSHGPSFFNISKASTTLMWIQLGLHVTGNEHWVAFASAIKLYGQPLPTRGEVNIAWLNDAILSEIPYSRVKLNPYSIPSDSCCQCQQRENGCASRIIQCLTDTGTFHDGYQQEQLHHSCQPRAEFRCTRIHDTLRQVTNRYTIAFTPYWI
jgi:hypothetical protein